MRQSKKTKQQSMSYNDVPFSSTEARHKTLYGNVDDLRRTAHFIAEAGLQM